MTTEVKKAKIALRVEWQCPCGAANRVTQSDFRQLPEHPLSRDLGMHVAEVECPDCHQPNTALMGILILAEERTDPHDLPQGDGA